MAGLTSKRSTQYAPPISAQVVRPPSTRRSALATQRSVSSAASTSSERSTFSAASNILKFYQRLRQMRIPSIVQASLSEHTLSVDRTLEHPGSRPNVFSASKACRASVRLQFSFLPRCMQQRPSHTLLPQASLILRVDRTHAVFDVI